MGRSTATSEETWQQVSALLHLCVSLLRTRKGCEEATITVCIRNGRWLDTYTVPDDAPITEMLHLFGKNTVGGKWPSILNKPALESNEPASLTKRLDISLIGKLNTTQFRKCLTSIRISLGLVFFDWPKEARDQFHMLTNDPIPSGPGRPNSGKVNIILILTLSTEVDPAWNRAVTEQMRRFRITGRREEKDRIPEIPKNSYQKEAGKTLPQKYSAKKNDQPLLEGPRPLNPKKAPPADRTNPWNLDFIWKPATIQLIVMSRSYPNDNNKVINSPSEWPNLTDLLKALRHPRVRADCHWFIQQISPDGNCLFYATMTTVGTRGIRHRDFETVQRLRTSLKNGLKQLSRAGLPGSPFRRDCLASCLQDVEIPFFQERSFAALNVALRTNAIEDVENFLVPLRIYVANCAEKVGGTHWGCYPPVELSILATITGTAIEVLRQEEREQVHAADEHTGTFMCDTRPGRGDRYVTLDHTALYLPVKASLPSPDEHFFGPSPNLNTSSGWVGQYPLLKVALNRKHYDACTSNMSFPVPPGGEAVHSSSPLSTFFNYSDTLTEPYSELSDEEKMYFRRASTMIDHWREAIRISEESGSGADITVMRTRESIINVSRLSHLQIPSTQAGSGTSTMVSDELLTGYMHLLEKRADRLCSEAQQYGKRPPPRTFYKNGWSYNQMVRGGKEPNRKRQKPDYQSFCQVVIPALIAGHLVLDVWYVKEYAVGVYDPFGHPREDVFDVVKKWAATRVCNTQQKQWRFLHITESRNCVQKGGIDCGIYVCKAAESLGLGIPIRISQWDIGYVRRRMLVEIFQQRATAIAWPRT